MVISFSLKKSLFCPEITEPEKVWLELLNEMLLFPETLKTFNSGQRKLLYHTALIGDKISGKNIKNILFVDSVYKVLPPHERLVYRGP